jgi:hypothetical protein
MEKIEIEINGKPVTLTEFPAKIIMNTIICMLQTLRDVDGIETAVIRLKNTSK